MNNRRKETQNFTKESSTNITPIESLDFNPIYIPPDNSNLKGPDKEAILDPEEEFQVDESNHGLYLLNYSDTNNVTQIVRINNTTTEKDTKENIKIIKNEIIKSVNNTYIENNGTNEVSIEASKISNKTLSTIPNNGTEVKSKQIKTENEKDKINNTLFMSDEIYNHFRPLESELPVEEMAPFIFFGQKLGGSTINDNLTNSPSLSASTKSVNFIVAPPDKRKFNSRYSATEKYKSSSANEDEVNEDMDVAVVKNIIEKNKVRNTVKGLAPARHVGLVNAYRKYTTVPPTRTPNIVQLNNNETTSNNTITSVDKTKEILVSRSNGTINPRNYTRGYLNPRRRPARVTSNTESTPAVLNATTEKASTLVYTAVVTSVSITSSMKGQNKTELLDKENELLNVSAVNNTANQSNIPKTSLNENDTITPETVPIRQYKHRIRIRTTTTQSPEVDISISSTPFVYVHKPTPFSSTTEISTQTQSKISERLANLFKQTEIPDVNATSGITLSTIRPQNILKRRRRPTTTTTTSTTTPASTLYVTSESTTISTTSDRTDSISSGQSTSIVTTPKDFQATNTSLVVVSRSSFESNSKEITPNLTSIKNNISKSEDSGSRNEEVVIEPDKTYTTSYVLAGLGFLPVAAIVVFVLRNVFNKKTKELDTDYEGYFDDGDIKKESPITPVARPPMPPPTKPDQKWEFPRNKLRLQTLLGQGNFGQVGYYILEIYKTCII